MLFWFVIVSDSTAHGLPNENKHRHPSNIHKSDYKKQLFGQRTISPDAAGRPHLKQDFLRKGKTGEMCVRLKKKRTSGLTQTKCDQHT